MGSEQEKLEQARLISATTYQLHRYHLRRLVVDESSASCPAPTPQQFHLLMTVRQYGSVSVKKLAEALRLKAPSVSLMVDRLVEMKSLTREQNPADRREVIIRLSAEENARIEEVEKRMLLSSVEIVDKIGPEYTRMWCEVCSRIQAALAEDQSQ